MRKIRQKVSLQEWEERIHARQLSGQTVAAWCETHGISVHAYYYWLRKLREKAVKLTGEPSALVPSFLELGEAGGLLSVEDPQINAHPYEDESSLVSLKLPGLLLEVAGRVNRQEIKAALVVLKSLCC